MAQSVLETETGREVAGSSMKAGDVAGGAGGADVAGYCRGVAERARAASRVLSTAPGRVRDAALERIAGAIEGDVRAIVEANGRDLEAGRGAGLSPAMLDRLEMTSARLTGKGGVAESVRQIAAQDDPVGRVMEGRVLGNGLRLERVRVPIGVVLIIFESRPNVTADAAALCLKSGNAAILRGGKEALHTNRALAACVQQGLRAAGLPGDAVQLIGTTDRSAVGELVRLEGLIDVCIPRGGESLIRSVVEQARVPVIKHYTGNCHVYLHADAPAEMAVEICINAKTQRPGVCNAVETILVHRDAAESGLLARVCRELAAKGVEVRGDTRTCARFEPAKVATESDWGEEYLELIVAMRVVDSLEDAVAHINRYGSGHTDAIVTRSLDAADRFVAAVDAANVFVNCSTRFSDGQQYGLGAEIGISTDKLHARGPMGAADLTTYKWVARGTGQVRS